MDPEVKRGPWDLMGGQRVERTQDPAQGAEAPILLVGGYLGGKTWRLGLSRARTKPLMPSQTSRCQLWSPHRGGSRDIRGRKLVARRSECDRDVSPGTSCKHQTTKKQKACYPDRPQRNFWIFVPSRGKTGFLPLQNVRPADHLLIPHHAFARFLF